MKYHFLENKTDDGAHLKTAVNILVDRIYESNF
jgi:hypothetical protein